MGRPLSPRSFLAVALLLVLAVVALSCSELDDTLTQPQPRTLEVHPAGWIDPVSALFHGKEIRAQGWQMAGCQKCHGGDYAGGIVEVSCLTCHPATPEDCTTCHGGAVGDLPAPPPDIDGHLQTTATGVGAHVQHLQEGDLRVAMECSSCHQVPDQVYEAGHVDSDLPAEVTFAGLALADSAQPVWDRDSGSCANVYCHGAFELGNQENTPIWTLVDGSQDACGTCHGLPPPDPHPQVELCEICHSAVVDADKNILDKTLHINGQTDFAPSTSKR